MKTVALALTLAAVALPQVASAAVVVATVKTGTPARPNNSTVVTDPNWQINAGLAYVSNSVPSAWFGPTTQQPGTGGLVRWITSTANGAANVAPGTYLYTTTFNVTGAANLASLVLSGVYSADNRLTRVLLNGVQIFAGPATPFDNPLIYNRENPFSQTANNFRYGVNNLTFVVDNASTSPNPAGLRVDANVTGAVPEPATWFMLIAGFGIVGFAMRRRRNVRVSFA